MNNFHPDRLVDIKHSNTVPPALNLIEFNPVQRYAESLAFICEQGVQTEAWALYAEVRNHLFDNAVLLDIGRQHARRSLR